MQISNESKVGIGIIIASVLIVVAALAFSTAAPDSVSDDQGFQGGCPPKLLPTDEELAVYAQQDISDSLITNLRQAEHRGGAVITKTDNEAFCISDSVVLGRRAADSTSRHLPNTVDRNAESVQRRRF